MISTEQAMKIAEIARYERKTLENKYGRSPENLMGKCIEATDRLVEIYKRKGFSAEAKQVWCLYEYFENCTDCCYEEHWLVKLVKNKETIYIDITMDQFQWAFSKKLPKIYTGRKLPNFYLTRKPGKGTLDKCGWNDWYNYGDYVNNFDYWGIKR